MCSSFVHISFTSFFKQRYNKVMASQWMIGLLFIRAGGKVFLYYGKNEMRNSFMHMSFFSFIYYVIHGFPVYDRSRAFIVLR